MKNNWNVSRRDSLKGIFATGTIIGGAGAGFTLVSAGDGDDATSSGVDEIDFRGCSSVFVVLTDEDALSLEVTIRVFNEETNGFENVAVTITSENVRRIPGQFGQRPVYEFDVHEFFERSESSDDKILGVTVGDESVENPNRCAENVPENGNGGNGSDDDDENGNGDEPIDPDEIRLVAICVDSANDSARFRIDNDTDQEVDLEYEVYSSGDRTPITVEANSTTYFDVDAVGGEATVVLYYDDEQIDVKASNTEVECTPADELRLVAICVDADEDVARFRVDNETDQERSVIWRVYGTEYEGTVDVPAGDSVYFWVPAPDGEATVLLFYEGEEIDVKASNTEEVCEYEDGENGEEDPDDDDDEDPDDDDDEDPDDDDDEDPDDDDDEDPDDDDDEDPDEDDDEDEEPEDEAGDKGGHIDTDKVDLIAVCHREGSKKKDGTKDEPRGKFRVENNTKTDATFSWKVSGDQSGTVSVPEKDSRTFWVDLDSSDDTTVTLYYEGERIDERAANVDDRCET